VYAMGTGFTAKLKVLERFSGHYGTPEKAARAALDMLEARRDELDAVWDAVWTGCQ